MKKKKKNDILQGTLVLLVLRTLKACPHLHGYALTSHIQMVSKDLLRVGGGIALSQLSIGWNGRGGSGAIGGRPKRTDRLVSTP